MIMKNIIDLQVHSVMSDGAYTPIELVGLAQKQGLQVIALTDHDTVDGISVALEEGIKTGVTIIPGIEITVLENNFHILGLGIDHTNPELLQRCAQAKEGRMLNIQKWIERLHQHGFKVELSDVVKSATGPSIGKPHIAAAVLAKPENNEVLKNITTVPEFIDTYMPGMIKEVDKDVTPEEKTDQKNADNSYRITASQAIRLIHSTGGVAIWSHPAVHYNGKYNELEIFLAKLIEEGLDGVEVFVPCHTKADVWFMQGLAIKYDLLRTAGSDFHKNYFQELTVGASFKKSVMRLWNKVTGGVQPSNKSLNQAASLGDYKTYGISTENIVPKLLDAIQKRRKSII